MHGSTHLSGTGQAYFCVAHHPLSWQTGNTCAGAAPVVVRDRNAACDVSKWILLRRDLGTSQKIRVGSRPRRPPRIVPYAMSLHRVNPYPGHELLYQSGVNGSRKQGH